MANVFQPSSQTTNQPVAPHPTKPEPSLLARPVVPAVIGKCNHVARSKEHTCGNPRCIEWYGY